MLKTMMKIMTDDQEELSKSYILQRQPLPTIEKKRGIIGFRREECTPTSLSQTFPDPPPEG